MRGRVRGACVVRAWRVRVWVRARARVRVRVRVLLACAKVLFSSERSCCSAKYLIALTAMTRMVIASTM